MIPKPIGWLIMLAWCALAGCAGQQQGRESTLPQSAPTMGEESSERMRARIHTELASGYFEIGNLPVALEETREALRADASYGPAYNIAGVVYGALNEDRLAEENFQRALKLNPNDSDANHNYGQFLCQRKREEEGIRYFLAAVRNPLYGTPERSYTNAGVCARRRGDPAGAENYFQLALKSRTAPPQALYNMADLAYSRGDFSGAKAYLSRLTQVAVPNAEVLWLGVRVERQLGDRNSEASYALQLRNKFPDSKEARALSAGEN